MAGKYFEEFTVGDVFHHQPGRTVTETDNLLFTTMTMNPQPLHLDTVFSKNAEFGQRLVNSIFTLGLAVGLSVGDTTLGTTVGNLGFERVEFPKPVFIGEVRADGQFDVVWKTDGLVPGDAWSDYLPGSKDLEADWVTLKCGNYNKVTRMCGGA